MATASKLRRSVISVGEYEIDLMDTFEKGAYGVVRIATDSKGNKVVAKQILTEGKDEAKMSKIVNSFDKLLALDHTNIVKYFYANRVNSSIWIIMEYCPFKDLLAFYRECSEGTPLTEIQKMDIMIQSAQGLEYLHKNHIIHRDIKPNNILISNDDPILVKLTDFDLCKILPDGYETSLMTTNVGTDAFKAPEFFQRNEHKKLCYHRNVDIFALGLTYLALIQDSRNLLPQIETPDDDSEIHSRSIGRLIAERIKYEKKPLDVICVSALAQKLRSSVSESQLRNLKLRSLIWQMTHHRPENRLSATDVLKKLNQEDIQNSQGNTDTVMQELEEYIQQMQVCIRLSMLISWQSSLKNIRQFEYRSRYSLYRVQKYLSDQIRCGKTTLSHGHQLK